MKRYRILVTGPAVDDLRSIAQYIANELLEPAIARRLIGKIKGAVMNLAELPTRHALVADDSLAAQGIRRLLVENYIVFYMISQEDETVTVVRLLHGRRNWEHLL